MVTIDHSLAKPVFANVAGRFFNTHAHINH